MTHCEIYLLMSSSSNGGIRRSGLGGEWSVAGVCLYGVSSSWTPSLLFLPKQFLLCCVGFATDLKKQWSQLTVVDYYFN